MSCLCPRPPSKVASDLLNGYGDIIAAAIYITEDRKKIADFVPAGEQQARRNRLRSVLAGA